MKKKQLKCYIYFMVLFHMFQVIYAHEWMNDAHDHEMQVKSGKTNTRGVTALYWSIHHKDERQSRKQVWTKLN